jgi:hypothetical protein
MMNFYFKQARQISLWLLWLLRVLIWRKYSIDVKTLKTEKEYNIPSTFNANFITEKNYFRIWKGIHGCPSNALIIDSAYLMFLYIKSSAIGALVELYILASDERRVKTKGLPFKGALQSDRRHLCSKRPSRQNIQTLRTKSRRTRNIIMAFNAGGGWNAFHRALPHHVKTRSPFASLWASHSTPKIGEDYLGCTYSHARACFATEIIMLNNNIWRNSWICISNPNISLQYT